MTHCVQKTNPPPEGIVTVTHVTMVAIQMEAVFLHAIGILQPVSKFLILITLLKNSFFATSNAVPVENFKGLRLMYNSTIPYMMYL